MSELGSDLGYNVQIRALALKWAVKSYTDLEQPRSANGYTSGNLKRDEASTESIVTRAKAFEGFLSGSTKDA